MNGVPQGVLDAQPRLYIDPDDLRRNREELLIKYCVNRTETATYYTYVYVWTFSDTPWYFELLGYPDHSWDYEPVIVCIDNQTRAAKYIYDKGHYRAGVTTSRELDVEPGTHRFSPSARTGGRTFSATNFREMTDEQLRLMNNALEGIPRLPFHRQLSLNWACKSPARVEEEGQFSTDTRPCHVPAQVNGLGGAAAGAAGGLGAKAGAGAAARGLGLPATSAVAKAGAASAGAAAGIGAVSGLAGGVVGGIVSEAVQNATENKPLAVGAGTLAGAATGAAIGAAIGSIVPGVGTAAGAIIGGVAGAVGGFLASIW